MGRGNGVRWLATAIATVVVALGAATVAPGPDATDTSDATSEFASADLLFTDSDQPRTGDGWRLLAAARGIGPLDDAAVAEDEAAYAALWRDTLRLRPEPPAVDFTGEVVVWFGAVHSGTCPDLRLDDVVVDSGQAPAVVHPTITLVGAPSFCTADANPYAFVVALDRSVLPDGPYVVRPDGDPDDPDASPPADAGRRG